MGRDLFHQRHLHCLLRFLIARPFFLAGSRFCTFESSPRENSINFGVFVSVRSKKCMFLQKIVALRVQQPQQQHSNKKDFVVLFLFLNVKERKIKQRARYRGWSLRAPKTKDTSANASQQKKGRRVGDPERAVRATPRYYYYYIRLPISLAIFAPSLDPFVKRERARVCPGTKFF